MGVLMKRYHEERRILVRQQREARRLGKPLPAGYYRKRDAHDCGHTRCGICHREKRFGHTLTRQELAAEQRFKEQSE
jgi:hypothetical protein